MLLGRETTMDQDGKKGAQNDQFKCSMLSNFTEMLASSNDIQNPDELNANTLGVQLKRKAGTIVLIK